MIHGIVVVKRMVRPTRVDHRFTLCFLNTRVLARIATRMMTRRVPTLALPLITLSCSVLHLIPGIPLYRSALYFD